jgi:hypothetical protein
MPVNRNSNSLFKNHVLSIPCFLQKNKAQCFE